MRNPFLMTGFFALAFLLSCTGENNTKTGMETGIGRESNSNRLFTIDTSDSTTILYLRKPWQGGKDIETKWILAKKEEQLHHADNETGYIDIPPESVICMSTTHVAMIERLGREETIKGISGVDYIISPKIRALIDSGYIKEVGYESNLNVELIVSMEPDLIFAYGVGKESSGYFTRIEEEGIPVIYISDHLESEPLARLEWIKVFGAIYNCADLADSCFSSTTIKYNKIKEKVLSVSDRRPVVMTGFPYKDTWFVSPGNSYISNLIRDAGGKYLWEKMNSEYAIPMGLEVVFSKAQSADIWINTGTIKTIDELVSFDKRFMKLRPVLSKNVFNNNMRMGTMGGNDYWESGILNPDLILGDLSAIMHPTLFADHSFVYYKKIESP